MLNMIYNGVVMFSMLFEYISNNIYNNTSILMIFKTFWSTNVFYDINQNECLLEIIITSFKINKFYWESPL